MALGPFRRIAVLRVGVLLHAVISLTAMLDVGRLTNGLIHVLVIFTVIYVLVGRFLLSDCIILNLKVGTKG
jgi:hypothetical protein